MKKYLTKLQAAEYLTQTRGLPVSQRTLSQLITYGGGPIYQKFGKRVVYTQASLDAWADTKLSNPLTHSNMEVQNER